MSGSRLASGGCVDRARALRFTFDGRAYTGHAGDTLASMPAMSKPKVPSCAPSLLIFCDGCGASCAKEGVASDASDTEAASASLLAKFMFILPGKIWETTTTDGTMPPKAYPPDAIAFDRRRHFAHPPTPEQRCDKIAYDSHTDRNYGKPGNALQKCKRGFVPDIVTPSRKWRGSLYQLVKVARPIV